MLLSFSMLIEIVIQQDSGNKKSNERMQRMYESSILLQLCPQGTSKNPHQYVKKTLDQVRMNKFTGVLVYEICVFAMNRVQSVALLTSLPATRSSISWASARIIRKQATAPLETVASSFMIAPTTRLAGRLYAVLHQYSSVRLQDKEFEEEQRRKRKKMEENKGDDDDDDEDNKYVIDTSDEEENDLPFACFICRKPFVNPVKTKYAHLLFFLSNQLRSLLLSELRSRELQEVQQVLCVQCRDERLLQQSRRDREEDERGRRITPQIFKIFSFSFYALKVVLLVKIPPT